MVEDVLGYDPQLFYEDPNFDLRIVYRPDRHTAQELVEDPWRSGVIRLVHRRGAVIWIALTKFPRFDRQRRLLGIEALVHTISEEQASLFEALPSSRPTWTSYPLSPRELEVLGLVARGHTDLQIAAMLGISPRTVERHMAHVLMKFGVHTRAAAVAVGYSLALNGMLDGPSRQTA